jgi:hypothetical protein
MAAKKQLYTEIELQWAESQLLTWREYVDNNPLHTLTDRLSYKETKTGGMIPMVVASIEQQGKFIQDTMKNYLSLLKEVDAMRAIEEAKKEARGSASVPHRMQ